MMSIELIIQKESSLQEEGGEQGAAINHLRCENSSVGTSDRQIESSQSDQQGAFEETMNNGKSESIADESESNGTDDPVAQKENFLLWGQEAFLNLIRHGHSNVVTPDEQMESSLYGGQGAYKEDVSRSDSESIACPNETNGTNDPLTYAVSLDVRIKATGSIAHIVWLVEGRYYGRITDGNGDWFYRTGTLVWLEVNECEVL